jgi:hypothetical protein
MYSYRTVVHTNIKIPVLFLPIFFPGIYRYCLVPHFVLYLVPRYFLFVLRVLPFTQSPVRGCRHRGLNRFHRGHAAYIPYILTRDATTNVAKPLPVLFQA